MVFAVYAPEDCLAAEDTRMALFPLAVDDAGKYAVLQDGITAMLAGRLAAKEGVTIVESTLDEQQRREFAAGYPETSVMAQLGVEYIGSGRIVAEGDMLQLRMQLYAADGAPPEQIEVAAAGDQEILAAVDHLASRIAMKVVGEPAPATLAGDDAAQTTEQGLQAFRTEHPDRRYKEEIVSGAAVSSEDAGMAISRGDFSRRKTELEDTPVAVAQEDINDDGVDEIVLLFETGLRILQYDRGIVKETSRFDMVPSLEVHAMNLADLDDDGQSEIYVSAVKNGRFASMILTWSEQLGFRIIMENIRYGIRPLELPGEGGILAGQASSMKDDAFLKPGVFRLKVDRQNSTVEKGKTITLPRGLNLFDFVVGDLDGDGLNETIAITSNMKMVVYGPDNRMRWRSERDYGGSLRYLGSRWQGEEDNFPTGNPDQDGELALELQYLPVALRLADSNGDGNMDIISARNELAMDNALKFFPNLRSFSSGRIVCLTWEDGGMKELWNTEAMNGHVAGFDFIIKESSAAEKENTTNVRLVVGHSGGKGLEDLLSFTGGQNALLVYDFAIGSPSRDSHGSQ
jgi:hypothetical protein